MINQFLYTRKVIANELGVSVPTLMRFIKYEGCPVAKDKVGSYCTTTARLEKWYSKWIEEKLKKEKAATF
jgi:hypothetical protein